MATVRAFHATLASGDNPTPVWLKDMLMNQFNHLSMMMWYKDGRIREYEAWSCADVDSVHNGEVKCSLKHAMLGIIPHRL